MNADTLNSRSVRCLCLTLLLWLPGSFLQAHPGSYVDAWARIDKTLQVRVILFLDDVLATQDVRRQQDQSLIPSADVIRGLQSFGDRLPKLLTVYDADGRRLTPQITQRPRWQPADRGLDLQADGSLRLTWELQFPWNPKHQSFSVHQQFVRHDAVSTTDDATQATSTLLPAELRLRVKHLQSTRRLQANIAHHQPHTIMLSSRRWDAPRRAAATASAQFILQAGRLIHEFNLPLALVDQTLSAEVTSSQSDTIRPQIEQQSARARLAAWTQQHLRMSVDGQLSTPTVTVIDLLSVDNERIDGTDAVPFVGTRAGFRTIHSLSGTPRRIDVAWTGLPSSIEEVQVSTLNGRQAATRLADSRTDVDSALTYSWDVSASPTGEPPVAELNIAVSAAGLWRPAAADPLSRLAAGVGAAIVAVAVGWRVSRKRRLAAVTMVLLATMTIATIWPSSNEPDSQVAATLIRDRLNEVYHAGLLSDDEAAVDRLIQVLSPDLVETVFEHMASMSAEDPDRAPLVRLHEVRMLSCRTGRYTPSTTAEFECEWQVKGDVLHWGHQHQRTMRLAGTIQTETSDSGCRINGITLQSVEAVVIPADS